MCNLQEHIEREKREREAATDQAANERLFSCPEQDAE
jgi:hypothetical protein